jgi:chemotaxis protein CheD
VTAARLQPGAPSRALSDTAEDVVVVHLYSGQVFASAHPCTISTVLGSCVAVCLLDPVRRFGAANHYLLPLHVVGGGASPRFGNVAIEQVVEKMVLLGSRKRDLQAKVFGGASTIASKGESAGVLPARRPIASRVPEAEGLGAQNVEVARRALAQHGIPIVAEDVGGTRGRKLLFRTDEGHAWIRKL